MHQNHSALSKEQVSGGCGQRKVWQWWPFVGIVFEELQANDISYKIRLRHEVGFTNSWDTDVLGPNFDAAGPRIDNKCVCAIFHFQYLMYFPSSHLSSYLSEGFLHLQKLVGAAIIEWRSMERMGVSVSVRV